MKNILEDETELQKLTEIFKDVDSGKKKLVEGLLEDAAFLYNENSRLKSIIAETGMVRVHPDKKELQKPTEAARQYLKNVNSYAVIIKALGSVLSKNAPDEEDEFDKWLAGKKAADG